MVTTMSHQGLRTKTEVLGYKMQNWYNKILTQHKTLKRFYLPYLTINNIEDTLITVL